MARTDNRFRAAHNRLLDLLRPLPPGTLLPPETRLAAQLGVSRTVVRAALRRLGDLGVIRITGHQKHLLRAPQSADALPERAEYISLAALEERFLHWVLRFDVPAGTALNVAQLAKEFSVPPHLLTEFLAGLGQFGLVERRPLGGWRLLGFTADYARELTEFRTLIEVNAARTVACLDHGHPVWAELASLERRHHALLDHIDTAYRDFPPMDGAFHACLNSAVQNRFVTDFQKVISLIFHYHYQWDKQLDRQRNEAAAQEHLILLAAMRSGDPDAAEAAMRAHLTTARETLLGSLRGHHLGQGPAAPG